MCGYPPFEGDDSTEIFRNVLKQELKFDPEHWRDISKDAQDLIRLMLDKNPKTRITAEQCLAHNWFLIQNFDTPMHVKENIAQRLKTFRAPKKI